MKKIWELKKKVVLKPVYETILDFKTSLVVKLNQNWFNVKNQFKTGLTNQFVYNQFGQVDQLFGLKPEPVQPV